MVSPNFANQFVVNMVTAYFAIKSFWHQSSPQFSTNNRAYISATGLKQTVMKGERCLIFTESSKRTSQFEAYITLLSAFWKKKQNFWVDNKKNLSEAATDRLLEQFVTGEVDMDVGTGCGHLFTFTDIVDIGIGETFPPLWPSPIQTQYSQRDYLVHSGSWIFFGCLWIFIEYNGYFLTRYDQAPLSYNIPRETIWIIPGPAYSFYIVFHHPIQSYHEAEEFIL